MNVLVTGGAGFIGSHLVERLVRENHKVTVLDNLLRGNKIPSHISSAITFIEGDVRNYQDVCRSMSGIDVVYHFAAVLGVDVVADFPVEQWMLKSLEPAISLMQPMRLELLNCFMRLQVVFTAIPQLLKLHLTKKYWWIQGHHTPWQNATMRFT